MQCRPPVDDLQDPLVWNSSGVCVEGVLDGLLQGYAQSASGKTSEHSDHLDRNKRLNY